MNAENPTPGSARPSLLRNWLSLAGLVIGIGSLFSFVLLFLLDALAPFTPLQLTKGKRDRHFLRCLTWDGEAG